MNTLRTKLIVGTSSLLLLCAGVLPAQKQGTAPAPIPDNADTRAIRKSLDDWADAYNRHDAHGASVTFTKDADMISIAGFLFKGQAGIEDHYGRTFTTSLVNAHRVDTIKSVRFLSPTIAAVDVDWVITGSTAKTADDHSLIPERKGILALIFVKDKGQWLTAVSHEIEFPAAKPKKDKEQAGQ